MLLLLPPNNATIILRFATLTIQNLPDGKRNFCKSGFKKTLKRIHDADIKSEKVVN